MAPLLRGITSITVFLLAPFANAGDWPMWRADAYRSAASTAPLPDGLKPLWKLDFAPRVQAWDDPLNLDLMTYDRVIEPIVMEGRMFVGFNDRDKVAAFDTSTGEELWSFYTDAPVRLPAAGWDGRVYFTSDDGSLYCVDAATGQQQWTFRAAPSARKAIGNRRVVSVWPARGGPVVRDETVYFAGSIWPMMGTFIYALDARTGEARWVNDSTGAQYINQPHSAPSFAGVAPQGALVATEEDLVVPGGRSVPAVFRRDDGSLRYFEINAGGKGTGGSFVSATDSRFYVHTRLKGTRAFNLESGLKTAFMPNEPVLSGDVVYSAQMDEDRAVVRAYDSADKQIWELDADGTGDLIQAGSRLYAAGNSSISVISLPGDGQPASIVESIAVTGQIERLLAADDKLFAVTSDGSVLAFGTQGNSFSEPGQGSVAELEIDEGSLSIVQDLLEESDATGYAFWFGAADDPILRALAADSPFTQLAVVDAQQDRVDRLRRHLDHGGLYGQVTAHCSDPAAFRAPRYVANLLFVENRLVSSVDEQVIAALYESVRPYGGVMHLLADSDRTEIADRIRSMDLEQAEVSVSDHSVIVRKVGRLPGSADWTHQYGDVANTVKSDDQRVKLPLGILWFGGSSNMDVLPRHGHGPPEQVVGGRLFIEGMNSISARDVYTGRVLWKREFRNLGTYDVYFDDTYENTPLNPKYNQVHIPGANGRGTNYIVTEDSVYVLEGGTCHVLDAATGETTRNIELPPDADGVKRQWGYIGIYGDLLIGGHGFAMYRERNNLTFESEKNIRRNRAGFASKSLDRAASLGLVVFDRHSGAVLWKAEARHSFWHNGIIAGGGRVYCLDRTPALIEAALRRRGTSRADSYRIVAFDAQTGTPEWEIDDNVFGTWLGYSEEHDVLLQAGAAAGDRLYAEVGRGMAVYEARTGETRWELDSLSYAGPCMLHNDWIITNTNSYTESAGAFHLLDGRRKMIPNPLTGELQPWKMTRAYGCNTVIASEHLLTFRSGAAGFYDLLGESGGGNFGGFKSGCTSNLVVANGVLNAPDYTRTCSCGYQNQTSLAMIHMPELDVWTISPTATKHTTLNSLKSVGVNLGAPGDRRAESGTLWLEYPAVAGPSPLVSVEFNDDAVPFRHHSSSFNGTELPWVTASGLDGVEDVTIRLTLKERLSVESGLPIMHTSDDAEEQANGDVVLGSSDLELVEDSNTQLVGLRFNKVDLEQGAKVNGAWIQFVCDEKSTDPTSLIVTAEDVGNAEEFSTDKHDLSSRQKTQQEVAWEPPKWKRTGDAGEAQRTADLSALVQQVINREDWKSGNSMAFFISGSGNRTAFALQAQGANAARLIVDATHTRPQKTDQRTPEVFRVRLLFAAPQHAGEDVRRFDVDVQGLTVLKDVVVDRTGSLDQRFAVHTLNDVAITDELRIQLKPKQGRPVLSGVEILKAE